MFQIWLLQNKTPYTLILSPPWQQTSTSFIAQFTPDAAYIVVFFLFVLFRGH